MAYTSFDQSATDQMARSVAVYEQRRAARSRLLRFRHNMVWTEHPDGTHLHRVDTVTGELVADLGLKSEKLIDLHRSHSDQQSEARHLDAESVKQLNQVQRDNVAFGTARVPSIVVNILEVLWNQNLMDFYRVIGTHALYAYESAAGVTFDSPTMATNDVDLLWDVQKRVKFLQLMKSADLSMIDVLRMADPTFQRDEDNKESAINDSAFSVDFLRRQQPEPEPDAFPISGKDGDVFPVKARRAELFLSARLFEQPIVGLDGRMTCMRTINPQTFVEFKLWMSKQPDREFLKKGRDRRQAEAVQQLIDEGRLKPSADVGASRVTCTK